MKVHMRRKWFTAGLIIGPILVIAGCAGSPGQVPQETASPEPTNAVSTQEPSVSEIPLEQQIAELRIPAGLSDEQLAEAYIQLSNKWWVAGASDELRAASVEANLGWDVYLPQIAAENAEVFGPALYGADWTSNPEIQSVLQNKIAANLNLLQNYTFTAWSDNPENLEPYTSWMEVDQVTLVTDDASSRTLRITYSNHNNADKNAVADGTLLASEAVDLVFTELDGTTIVTSSRF